MNRRAKFPLGFLLSIVGLLGGYLSAPASVIGQDQSGHEIEINKRPLINFSESFRSKVEKGQVDLTQSFFVECRAFLTNKGIFDSKQTKFTKSEGDPGLVALAKEGIEAIGASGFLQYLQNVGANEFLISSAQQNDRFLLKIQSELSTKERARTVASGITLVLKVAGMQVKSEDERLLLNNTKVEANASIVSIGFEMAGPQFREFLLRKMAKQE